jgi:hypothetical protein
LLLLLLLLLLVRLRGSRVVVGVGGGSIHRRLVVRGRRLLIKILERNRRRADGGIEDRWPSRSLLLRVRHTTTTLSAALLHCVCVRAVYWSQLCVCVTTFAQS